MSPSKLWLITGVVGAILLAAVVWYAGGDRLTGADPKNVDLVATGKVIYAQHCASCHGVNLEGQPNWRERMPNGRLPAPPQNAEGHSWHHADKILFEITKNGVSGIVPGYESDMPAFKGTLSDKDIWAVLSYIEAMWPDEIRTRQVRLNRAVK